MDAGSERPPGRDSALEGKYLAEVKQAAQGTIIGDHARVTQTFQVSAPTPGPPASLVTPVPRQLPAAPRHFAGRLPQLKALTRLMEETAESAGTVVISAIDGTAGIGKTALAVYWAHCVADRFPDGQLYVNLRGFDPTGSAMTPAEAVRDFLDAFEVPPERIPVSLDGQTALYRTLLAGRRVLVVLDNARDTDQVRPLLPGSAGCLVVVTSRRLLTGLITAEGARPLTLDLLTDAESRELLTRRLGPERVGTEPHAVGEIVIRCARLPLALSIAAARAAAHPEFPLAALAGELRKVQGRLDAFDGGDLVSNVRAVFSWSYERLSPEAARVFRLLGIHPGPDFTMPAAASLAGIPPERVQPALAELAQAHLIKEHTLGRFVFHDLLRDYASEQTHTHDTEAERLAALCRLLDHYLHTAYTAALLLYPHWEPITLAPPHDGVTPEKLASYEQAWTWFEAEYPVLLAAIQLAADTRQHVHAWQLTWTLADDFFERRGHWHDWIATQQTALTSAQHSADRRGQAHAHRSLGRACSWLGRFDEAHAHVREALSLFEELGDQIGLGNSHVVLAAVFERQGKLEEALSHNQQALNLSRDAGYRFGQGRALNNVGWFLALLGDPQQALIHCQQSLALRRELGDRRGEANTLDSIGYAHHRLGHHEQAISFYRQALERQRELGNLFYQAAGLNGLGDALHATGDLDAARNAWQQALDILDHLGVVAAASLGADTDELRAKLRHLDRTTQDHRSRPP